MKTLLLWARMEFLSARLAPGWLAGCTRPVLLVTGNRTHLAASQQAFHNLRVNGMLLRVTHRASFGETSGQTPGKLPNHALAKLPTTVAIKAQIGASQNRRRR
jgi:hypothetical protein